MDDLLELYQELILDHNRRPRNRGRLDHPDHSAEGFNPLCGDRVHLDVSMNGDVIDRVRFDGAGCAISTASASLMSEAIEGRTVEEAHALFDRFHRLVTVGLGGTAGAGDGGSAAAGSSRREGSAGPEGAAGTDPPLGKLAAFAGVGRFPARVKCATLAWHTLEAALVGRRDVVSTE